MTFFQPPMARVRLSSSEEILTSLEICEFEPVYRAPVIQGLVERLDQNAFFQSREGLFSREMVALAAVEFALARVVGTQENANEMRFPLLILPSDARLALAKYNTTSTFHCRQKERIAAGEIQLSDIFLFTGDLQKYERFFEGKLSEEGLADFFRVLGENLNEAAGVVSDLFGGVWAEFQGLVWQLRWWSIQEYFQSRSAQEQKEAAALAFNKRWLGRSY
jgi:hypothetical protein